MAVEEADTFESLVLDALREFNYRVSDIESSHDHHGMDDGGRTKEMLAKLERVIAKKS